MDVVAVLLGSCQQASLEAVLKGIQAWDKGVPVLYLEDAVHLDSLSEALKQMVVSRLEMPPSYNKLLDSLHRAQVYREQFNHHSRSRGERREIELFRSLVGTSRQIQTVRELIMQVADKDVSVLIQGESGTGKEVIARNLYYHSERRDKPFVPINCGAIPAELLESELFGHEKRRVYGCNQQPPRAL